MHSIISIRPIFHTLESNKGFNPDNHGGVHLNPLLAPNPSNTILEETGWTEAGFLGDLVEK